MPIEQERIKNAEKILERLVEQDPLDKSIYMIQEPTYGYWLMLEGPYLGPHRILSTEDMKLKSDMADAVMALGRAGKLGGKIAVIGGGTGYVLRLLVSIGVARFDVYEQIQGVQGWNERREPKLAGKVNWIFGDYRESIRLRTRGYYDGIIYDLGPDPLNEVLLQSRLADDGVLFVTEE